MVRSCVRVICEQSPWMWPISRLSVAQVDSMAALSKQVPVREYDALIPQSARLVENSRLVFCPNSTGRRNTG